MTERTAIAASRRRFLRAAAGTALGAVFAGCAGVADDLGLGRAETGIDPDDLPTMPTALFRGDLARRGFYPDERVPEEVTVAWRLDGVNTGEHTASKASAVVAPTGDLLVPGDSGTLFSVSPDGEVSWQTNLTEATRGMHGTPVVAGDVAYVGSYDGVLSAVGVESGDVRWRADLGDAIGSSAAYHDGLVFVAVEYATPSGSMFAVDAATGEVEWVDRRPTDHPHSTPAIDLDAGVMVVGSNDGTLYAWDYPELEFSWTFDTGGPIKGPVATHDGAAFFGSWDHNVYRVALDDGAEEWSYPADADVMSGPAIDPRDGTLYVGSHDTRLHVLDLATGERTWTFDTGGMITGCPTVTGDHVLVGSYDANLYALDRDGREVWRVAADGWVSSTPLVHDGRVYYADRATDETDGAAYGLEAAA